MLKIYYKGTNRSYVATTEIGGGRGSQRQNYGENLDILGAFLGTNSRSMECSISMKLIQNVVWSIANIIRGSNLQYVTYLYNSIRKYIFKYMLLCPCQVHLFYYLAMRKYLDLWWRWPCTNIYSMLVSCFSYILFIWNVYLKTALQNI